MEFQISHFLWLAFSLLLGIGYAALLYPKNRPVTGVPRPVIFALRVFSIALISFLLFAPQIRSRKTTLEKPIIILAQDNSVSLTLGTVDPVKDEEYRASLNKLYDQLSEDYQVDTLLLGDSLRRGFAVDLHDKSTNISSLFEGIRNRYAGRNVGALIFASDGLYNRGRDPLLEALSLKVPVYSVALGDTNLKKDLLVANVNYNELIQAGNEFEVELQIAAHGSRGNRPRLRIYRGDSQIFSKVLNIDSDDFYSRFPVILPAQRPGTVRYTVQVDSLPREVSTVNNTRDFYVQARDTRKNILIIADAPHPDITAIRQSLGYSGTYEVDLGYVAEIKTSAMEKADLLILYQLPSGRRPLQTLASLIKKKPVLYVLGAQSDLSAFSSMQGMLDLKPAATLREVSATVNTAFPAFSVSDSLNAEIARLGALIVPFSDVRFKSAHYDLLYQDAGRFKTSRPLLSFSAGLEPRVAVLTAEGIWKWRLEAFNVFENSGLIDNLLGKTVQYLVANADKRRFRVYSSQEVYTDSEPIILNAELYNESLELLNTPDVALTLRAKGSQVYSYQFSRVNNSYILNMGRLPAGEYTYKAWARHGDMNHEAEGMVHVGANQLEFQGGKANHQLLSQLAVQSGGGLYYPAQLEAMYRAIKADEMVKTVAYEHVSQGDIIDLKWLFAMICALLFFEWFLRKRNGEL